MTMIRVCRGCGKMIAWIRTHGGQKMPVDLDQIPFVADRTGKEVFVTGDGRVTVGRRAEEQDNQIEMGYISHFATCPKADDFRKKKDSQKKETEQQISMDELIGKGS